VEEIRAAGVPVHAVDLAGDWAELDARQDLARFVLGTKAESLERLRPMDHGAVIGALVTCTREGWTRDPDAMLGRIAAELPADRLIVRSSALSEDGWHASGAGRHESVADVVPEPGALVDAIDRVFASYVDPSPRDQVLVQEMVRDVAMSGVVMTRTHALGAPYCVVNFDDATDRTDVVTGGGDARTVVCLRGAELRPDLPPAIAPVLSAVQKVEGLVGHDSLDIEFAVTHAGDVHILQVRPIARGDRVIPIDDEAIGRAVHSAQATVRGRTAPGPTLVGATTRYSVMTDWNPAEIVGTTPRALALSLYRYLVTDEVWARQRAEYGYRDVRPCALLVELAGHPYVDVRACFNSFVPAGLDDDLATRLVQHQLAVLAAHPVLHDKVEFDVLITCLDPTFAARAAELRTAGFTEAEVDALRDALRTITVDGFDRLDRDLATLDALRVDIHNATPPERAIDAAAYHLELARRRGTPVFAHLARAAFVATSVVRGLVATGAITSSRAEAYLATTETVFGRLQADAAAVRDGTLAWDGFVDRYGHLRPGTYDITSPRYAAAPEEYLRPLVEHAEMRPADSTPTFAWTPAEREAIAAELAGLGLPDDVDRLDQFVRAAIAAGEDGKFVFTRSLSDALEALAAFGASLGFDRNDLAHVRIADLLRCRDGLADPRAYLLRRVEEGVEEHLVTQGVALPAQIATELDLACFEQVTAQPNFVTRHAVEAPAVVDPSGPGVDVAGRVVLVPSADPGYDWLLARGIAGLVTMFGGANSHMAVRAAECSLPAAIGVGETRYEQLADASVVRLDCGARAITVVR
jgi:hypothetical protein